MFSVDEWKRKHWERRKEMKSEPFQRRQMTKKQIGVVQPFIFDSSRKEDRWNCSELEKLQRRFSELIEGQMKVIDEDHNVLERFSSLYSSLGSRLHLCPSSIELFLLTDLDVCSLQQWKSLHNGYPMWVMNTNDNPRRRTELRLFILDSSTGFLLWKDRFTSEMNLLHPAPFTLTFRHSSNQSSIMFKFDSNAEMCFRRFYSFFEENHLITSKAKLKKRTIRKCDISPPCHFKHFNHLHSHSFVPSIKQQLEWRRRRRKVLTRFGKPLSSFFATKHFPIDEQSDGTEYECCTNDRKNNDQR